MFIQENLADIMLPYNCVEYYVIKMIRPMDPE